MYTIYITYIFEVIQRGSLEAHTHSVLTLRNLSDNWSWPRTFCVISRAFAHVTSSSQIMWFTRDIHPHPSKKMFMKYNIFGLNKIKLIYIYIQIFIINEHSLPYIQHLDIKSIRKNLKDCNRLPVLKKWKWNFKHICNFV